MTKELAPGDKAPAFRVPTDGGAEISSAKLKGKPYVLYFYPKDNTAGCTREAVEFSAAQRKFAAAGVEIVGISKDSPESHEKFRKKFRLKVTLGSDAELEVANIYGVWVEKSLYGRRYMGMDRATFLVDAKGVIQHIWRKVKVPGHVEAVLSAAKAL